MLRLTAAAIPCLSFLSPPHPSYRKYHQHIGVVEEQLRASKEEMERCLSEYDELFRTIQRLSEELNSQITANGVLQASAAAPLRPAKPAAAFSCAPPPLRYCSERSGVRECGRCRSPW